MPNHDLRSRFLTRSPERVSLGGVTFYCDPRSFSLTTEYVRVDVTTLAGAGRFNYGTKANVYALDGYTSWAGLDGPGGLVEMERFRPQQGRAPALLPYRHPNRFRGIRWVYCDSFDDIMDGGSQYGHLAYAYRIKLTEYPRQSTPAAVRVAPASAGTILPY